MSLQNINLNPRFSTAIVGSKILQDDPLRIVDVGASMGSDRKWSSVGEACHIIGFEPNADEFNKLQSVPGRIEYHNVALAGQSGKRNFYILKWPYSSGFLQPNKTVMSRFANAPLMEVTGVVEFETVSLDALAKSTNIQKIDFIKLDTEGTELEIIKGGKQCIDNGVLGVEVEVAFIEYTSGRPLFSEVDEYMRKSNFQLCDLATYRHAKKALPPLIAPIDVPTSYGLTFWAQALYLRDAVSELTSGKQNIPWTENQLIKLIMLYEIHGFPDSAIELLETAVELDLIRRDFHAFRDMLVPPVFNRYVSLDFYRSLFSALPQPG